VPFSAEVRSRTNLSVGKTNGLHHDPRWTSYSETYPLTLIHSRDDDPIIDLQATVRRSGEDAVGFKIRSEELFSDLIGSPPEFPKYTTQLINLANQNAQGTRPKVVGQLSELTQEFPGATFDEWRTWYSAKYPSAIEDATIRVVGMIEKLRTAFERIDENMVREWVTDLVLSKTFVGLRFQESVLRRVAETKGETYRLATPEEESQGIDGYVGDVAVSVKPDTYKSKNMLSESISADLIYYKKLKDGIRVEFEF
jgi:hypothetical protein